MTRPTSPLFLAAENLFLDLLPLERSMAFRRRVFDARGTLEDLLEIIDPAADAMVQRRPRVVFDTMRGDDRDRAHDTFIAILALGEGLRHPEHDEWIEPSAFELAARSVARVLDALVPYVSLSDDGLRRVMLDDEPLEAALDRIANAR